MGDFEAVVEVAILRNGPDGQLHRQHDGGQGVIKFVGDLPGGFTDGFNDVILPALRGRRGQIQADWCPRHRWSGSRHRNLHQGQDHPENFPLCAAGGFDPAALRFGVRIQKSQITPRRLPFECRGQGREQSLP